MTALKMRKANKSVHFLHFHSYRTRLSPIFQQGNRNLHHIKDHVVICSWMHYVEFMDEMGHVATLLL